MSRLINEDDLERLAALLAHGNDAHREWIRDTLSDWYCFRHRVVPAPESPEPVRIMFRVISITFHPAEQHSMARSSWSIKLVPVQYYRDGHISNDGELPLAGQLSLVIFDEAVASCFTKDAEYTVDFLRTGLVAFDHAD